MIESTAAARLSDTPPPAPAAENVVAFLNAHPDFLSRHVAGQLRETLEGVLNDNPALLADLDLPHPPSGIASLPHVQLRLWRERLARLEHTISDLHDTAESNARLDRIMHEFARALLASDVRSAEQLKRIIHAHFSVDAIRLQPLAELTAEQIAPLQGWLDSHTPLCGRLSDAQRRVLFDADFPETGSAALIALQPHPKTTLILVLGRHAPDGFNPGQGTLFLEQIGQLAETFLGVPENA